MISVIFEAVADSVTAFATAVGNAVTSVAEMFIVQDATTHAYSLTMLGTLLLIGVGAGLLFWGFRLIHGLIKRA